MSGASTIPGLDGLLTLSRREGVDIRPTLLRVLTDLYVQARAHSADEEQQFVELASRLIDEVDDATHAAVRARLAIYPGTPAAILVKLGLRRVETAPSSPAPDLRPPAMAPRVPMETRLPATPSLSMKPNDAAEITEIFFSARAAERVLILQNVMETPLKSAPPIPLSRAGRACEILEMAAFAEDVESFTLELGDALILPSRITTQVVDDAGGEPLACAARALNMPLPVFERVVMFLDPQRGSSVHYVFRLSRLYDRLSERAALIMLAAWRGSTMAVARPKHRAALYDDERHRPRLASTPARPVQPARTPAIRDGSRGAGS